VVICRGSGGTGSVRQHDHLQLAPCVRPAGRNSAAVRPVRPGPNTAAARAHVLLSRLSTGYELFDVFDARL